MTASTTTLPAGEIEFFDNFEPGLKDGTYLVNTSQNLSAPGASIVPVSQKFIVQGPRFALDPSEIHTVFPPNGATAVFEEVLPHIVLNKRLLPWERDIPGLSSAVSAQTPWLALLVFSEGELLGPAGGGNYAQTLTVAQLLSVDPQNPASPIPDPNVRHPILAANTLTADDLALNCQAIVCPGALFAQIVPTVRELPYLAHARQVNTGNIAIFGQKDDGWFSVVVANRFPQAGNAATATTAAAAKKSIVHLVSLEGFGDLLTGTAPVAPTQPQIQLASLASWTFSCLADPAQTFGGLAQNLAYDPANAFALRPAASLVLRLPFTPTGATDAGTIAVQQRLNDGYVALGYHASSGEDGFAWYRGPGSAVVPNPVPGVAAFETTDAATIYDPATGLFDLSLATAWQVGRSLALSSEPFATALMRVRIAANATVEQLSAPTTATVHARLAALFSGGAIQDLGEASATGAVATPAAALRATVRAKPAAALRTLLAQPAVQSQLAAQIQANPDAQSVADWLGQLLLLRNVPFVHLVPDARMLPAESIRFFYVDSNWLGALVDGALGIGLGTSRESAVQEALTQQLEQMAQTAALAWRANQIGQTPPPAPTGPTAGFLLRSALASGWPGLLVTGTSAGVTVPLLRVDHLGPSVLLVLFNGVPDTVVLSEPQEGLEFGVDDAGAVDTRTVAPPIVTTGKHVPVFNPASPDAPSVAIRSGGQRVLNVSVDPNRPATPPTAPLDLLELLAQALNVAPGAIGPGDFAVQMVKGPEQLVFSLTPPPKPA